MSGHDEDDGEKPEEKIGKTVASFNIDDDVLAQLERVAWLTRRSKSNVVNLVLTRHLQTYVQDPELL